MSFQKLLLSSSYKYFTGDGIGINFEIVNIPRQVSSYCSSYILAESELLTSDKTKIIRLNSHEHNILDFIVILSDRIPKVFVGSRVTFIRDIPIIM